jgi:hypothetical protein
VRSVDWIFIVGALDWQYLDKYVTLDRMFYSLLLKQKAVAAQLLPHFVACRIARGGWPSSLETQQLNCALIV